MTFAHLLLGLILGKKFGYTLPFLIGSVLPDIDHIFVLIKNKHWRLKEVFEIMKHEDKYGERYKTPYTHSLLAWLIFSLAAFIFWDINYWINQNTIITAIAYIIGFSDVAINNILPGLAFSVAYLFHLLLDVADKDEMKLFYPFKKTIRGFLPVFSKWEILFVGILAIIYFLI